MTNGSFGLMDLILMERERECVLDFQYSCIYWVYTYLVTTGIFNLTPRAFFILLAATVLLDCRFQRPWAFAVDFFHGDLSPWFHPGTSAMSTVAMRLTVWALKQTKSSELRALVTDL